MLSESDLNALWLTIQLALITTAILLLMGIPIGWWLARTRWRFKFILDAVIALPLVLPPTVLGFYLLIFLGPKGPLGDTSLAFTFPGLIIGSVIYSLPFVVQPIQNAFSSIPSEQLEVASTLGSTQWKRFFSIALPLARPGVLTGAVLGFAHTLGEFGVVLMIGGNIPGSTRVVSIAIYDHVEGLNYGDAHRLALFLLVLSFLMLLFVYGLNRKHRPGLI
ncbi:MAG: molybdate ABC transporter permease subunit [Verrucomicrobiales bacterium]|nr:molybdate ABC transporter permease subunit [Verrucomicrobiales bacterium]